MPRMDTQLAARPSREGNDQPLGLESGEAVVLTVVAKDEPIYCGVEQPDAGGANTLEAGQVSGDAGMGSGQLRRGVEHPG